MKYKYTCSYCGKQVIKPRAKKKSQPNVFCNFSCYNNYRKAQPKTKYNFICAGCGVSIERDQRAKGEKQYCKVCFPEYHHKQIMEAQSKKVHKRKLANKQVHDPVGLFYYYCRKYYTWYIKKGFDKCEIISDAWNCLMDAIEFECDDIMAFSRAVKRFMYREICEFRISCVSVEELNEMELI